MITAFLIALAIQKAPPMARQTVTLYPTRDTWINGSQTTTAYGTDLLFQVGQNGLGEDGRALMYFNLSAYTSANLVSATLSMPNADPLNEGGNPGSPAVIYVLTQTGWTNNATHLRYDGTNLWNTAGGDYLTSVASVFPTPAIGDTGPASADVLAHAEYACANVSGAMHLILMSGTAGTHGTFFGHSVEAVSVANRPTLTLIFNTADEVMIEPDIEAPGPASTLIEADTFGSFNPTDLLVDNDLSP